MQLRLEATAQPRVAQQRVGGVRQRQRKSEVIGHRRRTIGAAAMP